MRTCSPGLMSKLYDYWSKHMGPDECSFYKKAIQKAGGRSLDLACAGGRLLLPLLKAGAQIDGVDSSPLMLELLRMKAKKAGLQPTLYCQKLEDLSIQKKYRLIFISLASFQLIEDRNDAVSLLKKCYGMLEDGGELIISFFLPWAEFEVNSREWKIVSDVKDRKRKVRYVRREIISHDLVHQVVQGKVRAEIWDGKFLLEMEERRFSLRWYSNGECACLLKAAGFTKIEMQRNYDKHKPALGSFMLFTAGK